MKFYSFLYVLLLLLLAACNNNTDNQSKSEATLDNVVVLTQEQTKQIAIATETLQMSEVASEIKVSGKIEAPPQNYISVSAPLGGFLKSTNLLPGMKIKKGEVLAVMEDQQYIDLQEQYLQTKTALAAAEKDYLRQKALNQDKTSSDKVFEQSNVNYETLKTTLAALREKLRLVGFSPDALSETSLSRQATLVSPIDGYVAKVNVNVGKYVAPSDVLFELVNPEDIHLAMTIFEKDIDKIEVGQKVIAFTNHSSTRYHADIILLGRNINADRSIDVHCHFDEYDHSLLPGMFMNAIIQTGARSVKSLPEEAVQRFDGTVFVFVANGKNTYKTVPVSIGDTENGRVEILNAAELEGLSVVTKGAYSLLMKLKNTNDEEH